jgi:hypothetical protein
MRQSRKTRRADGSDCAYADAFEIGDHTRTKNDTILIIDHRRVLACIVIPFVALGPRRDHLSNISAAPPEQIPHGDSSCLTNCHEAAAREDQGADLWCSAVTRNSITQARSAKEWSGWSARRLISVFRNSVADGRWQLTSNRDFCGHSPADRRMKL